MKNTCAVLLLCVLIFHGSIGVFLDKDGASSVLQRVRRANSFLEEMKRGNLERECVEEICDYEEAREVFEDDTKTKQFWLSYSAKEPCLTNPCKNNGTCVYLASTYYCLCPEGFEGKYCEKGFEETLRCLHVNGGCEQFCEASGPGRSCRCATGYTLGADGTSCVAHVEYPCGKIPLQTTDKQLAGGIHCPRGHCPWQALIDYNAESVCGGALLDAGWVVTAAHCVHQKDLKRLKVITVFLPTRDASQILSRRRRANSLFEEMKKGNMERECVEERCSYEEAREIFEDVQKTDKFWHVYYDGDACLSQPCFNGGECKDAIGPYTCFCQQGFKGYNCEIAIPALCETENGGCDHFCRVKEKTAVCSCAKGYELGDNGKSCHSNDPFKCGVVHPQKTRSIFMLTPNISNTENGEDTEVEPTVQSAVNATNPPPANETSLFGLDERDIVEEEPLLPQSAGGDTRIVNGVECPPGECPWQALLINENNIGFCGGTILNQHFILSAAHCMNESLSTRVVLGEFDTLVKEGREVIHDVDEILIHKNFMANTYHNDIALIKLSKPITFTDYIIPACLPEHDFAERVLMAQESGMVSGFGRVREGGFQSTVLQKLTVPYVNRATCIESSQFRISSRMFCAGYDQEEKDACQGDSGGPHVTRYKNTWYVTGVVSWGEGCARKGKYGVYTQVSKYIQWINNAMAKVMPQMGASLKPKAKRELLRRTPVRRV